MTPDRQRRQTGNYDREDHETDSKEPRDAVGILPVKIHIISGIIAALAGGGPAVGVEWPAFRQSSSSAQTQSRQLCPRRRFSWFTHVGSGGSPSSCRRVGAM